MKDCPTKITFGWTNDLAYIKTYFVHCVHSMVDMEGLFEVGSQFAIIQGGGLESLAYLMPLCSGFLIKCVYGSCTGYI